MVRVRVNLHSLEDTITRPILIKVVEDIKKYLGFTRDVYSTFDDNDKVDRDKDAIGNINTHSSPRSEWISVEHTEEPISGNELAISVIRPDHQSIFSDDKVGVYITPIYLNRKHTLSFKYNSKSRSLVNSFINKLRLQSSTDGMYIIHDLSYHYNIPLIILELLGEINDRINLQVTNQLTLEDYVTDKFINGLTTTNTPDGDILKSSVVMRENQLSVTGYISDQVSELKAIENKDTSSYSVEFEYVFECELPVQLSLLYPEMISNKMLPKKFLYTIDETNPSYKGNHTLGMKGLMDIRNNTTNELLRIKRKQYYLTIPSTDSFILPKPHPQMARILSVLTRVDENNKRDLFNVSDIGKITFKDSIINYLKDIGHNDIGIPYVGMLYIDLYKDGYRDYDNIVLMDSDLNITTTNEMDMSSTYRVCFNVLTNVSFLSISNRNLLRGYIDNEDTASESIVECFTEVFSIRKEELPDKKNDMDILLSIEDNDWVKFYTMQETVIVSGVMKQK